jgi:hypothetical protein
MLTPRSQKSWCAVAQQGSWAWARASSEGAVDTDSSRHDGHSSAPRSADEQDVERAPTRSAAATRRPMPLTRPATGPPASRHVTSRMRADGSSEVRRVAGFVTAARRSMLAGLPGTCRRRRGRLVQFHATTGPDRPDHEFFLRGRNHQDPAAPCAVPPTVVEVSCWILRPVAGNERIAGSPSSVRYSHQPF